MTPKDAQLKPWKLRKGGWFYVGETLSVYSGKPHDEGTHIPMSQLLRTLSTAGILARWDDKQQVLKRQP